MHIALKICKKSGCNALVKSGYCEKHSFAAIKAKEKLLRESWAELDKKKTPEQKAFYQSARWTQASKLHRTKEPLCRRCKENGRIVAAELVHHNPDLNMLFEMNLDPCDDQYLESLCFNCHQKELIAKRKNNYAYK